MAVGNITWFLQMYNRYRKKSLIVPERRFSALLHSLLGGLQPLAPLGLSFLICKGAPTSRGGGVNEAGEIGLLMAQVHREGRKWPLRSPPASPRHAPDEGTRTLTRPHLWPRQAAPSELSPRARLPPPAPKKPQHEAPGYLQK